MSTPFGPYRQPCERCKELEEEISLLKNKPCQVCERAKAELKRDKENDDPEGSGVFAYLLIAIVIGAVIYYIATRKQDEQAATAPAASNSSIKIGNCNKTKTIMLVIGESTIPLTVCDDQ